ncbi:glycosyltransferase [Parabacteroides sp. ZJ-118]|uniref:glycosyltransferase n=1 Tax=Parabacteroides sp. ZJ-118 TaxID=2709398 RepID=UPI001F14E2A8|nr:glycosyltransferase [Parabacteroides sp. ZJ-118]
MGVYIHNTIKDFIPDVIVVDGEPLILQSIKVSHPNTKVVALLNPTDVDNPSNDKEAMDFFNALYSLSDLAIVHGLRIIERDRRYNNFISINTIIRQEIMAIKNIPTNNIYCILGGGTVNVGQQFEDSTLRIGELCQKMALLLPKYNMHIICSSQNIFSVLNDNQYYANVQLHEDIISAEKYYHDACLVITRSGRNTLSELAYLGIPAISFVSGCAYRRVEQTNNINDLRTPAIMSASLDITPSFFAECCHKMIGTKADNILQYGNDEAIKHILRL